MVTVMSCIVFILYLGIFAVCIAGNILAEKAVYPLLIIAVFALLGVIFSVCGCVGAHYSRKKPKFECSLVSFFIAMIVLCFLLVILCFAAFFLKECLDYFLTESSDDLKTVFSWLSSKQRDQITNTLDDAQTVFDVTGYVSSGVAVVVLIAVIFSGVRMGPHLFKRVLNNSFFFVVFSFFLLIFQYYVIVGSLLMIVVGAVVTFLCIFYMIEESVVTDDLEEVFFFLLFGFSILLIIGGLLGLIAHTCCFSKRLTCLIALYVLLTIILLLGFAALIFVGFDVKEDFRKESQEYCDEHNNCTKEVINVQTHLLAVNNSASITEADIVEIYTKATKGIANLGISVCILVVVMLLIILIATCLLCREVCRLFYSFYYFFYYFQQTPDPYSEETLRRTYFSAYLGSYTKLSNMVY